MSTLSLKISLEDGKVIKTMQFDPSTSLYDACRVIRDKILEANLGEPKDYGIFLSSDEDNKKGVWLEPGRSLEYYMLRNGDVVEYKKKMRTLRVRMLDGTLKTMMVDDSQNVANLMVVICTKIGITNYDEYSLVREETKEDMDNLDNRSNYGTLTLKRKPHGEKERDAKMDQLRKKLRTDDEVNWIDPSKTLREQGVDEAETVLLRRKFFYSDQNIDSRDPVQLNLLYVQARDAIIDGTHPVTLDKGCEFAGIQCQIQFGDHKEDKHTTGFLDLKEFLPQSYVKVKGVEKKVFKEHSTHIGLSELDSKVQYTKTARALRTYGVAFFLVKEKMKGKNKLVPRLLGVTKDSVLRLDERTKEILQTWPLTTVRRWCASPNTFTLDFGDYSDQYYSVQTTEAEQILQVIAGYIDIILKKQKAKDHFGIEGDEGSTMVEDSVSPHKATILQHETMTVGKINTESLAKPAVMRIAEGEKPFSQGHMASAQYTTISGQVNMGHAPPSVQQTKVTTVMTEPQRALLSTITTGQEIIRQTEREIIRAELPELGNDASTIKWREVTLDTNKQSVSSQIAAMNAATAQVVTLTSGPTDEVDHTAVGAAITTIASNLPQVTKGVSMIAALMEDNDNGDRLLDATRRLCSAFSDLLKATEPETKEPRQNLLNAASRVGEASTQVLYTIGEETEENREIQDLLLALAKAVANTTAALVLKAKNIAATCKDDQQAQNRVISAATQCALATSQLVACAKVVAPTLQNPACREQLSGACRQVATAVERLVNECDKAAGPHGMADLNTAAQDVTRALDELLRHVNTDRRQARETIHETTVESIMTATERLCSSTGDTTEMVKQARLLGQATAELIHNIKIEAEKQPGSETQRRLLAAAKLLADATARMVEAARQCATSPHDKSKQEALCRAAEELRYVTTDYASSTPEVRRQLFRRLEMAAKQAASTGTQFIASAQNAGSHNTNRHSQETLVQECRTMAEHIPRLIEGVKGTMASPEDSNSQLALINASEAFLQPGTHVIQAARAVLPTVQDQSSALQLNNTTQQLATSCSELRSSVGRARSACTGLELDAAAQVIRSLQRELAEVDRAARECRLKPLPGESVESCSRELTSSARLVNNCTARLVSAAGQGNTEYCGRAAHDTAQGLARMADGARGVVATSQTQEHPNVIDTTQDVMSYCLSLVEESKRCLTSPEFDTIRLESLAKNVSFALDNSVNSLPGHQDVDSTIESINETMQILSMGEFPTTNKSYGQLQQELNVAAEGLNAASTETVQSAVVSPRQLGETSRQFGRAYSQLLNVSMEMAGQTTDYDSQSQMVVSMKNVSKESSRLLSTAKSVSNDPAQPNVRNQLSAAARAVTDSINYLVEVCTMGAPGQKECDSAVRSIQSVRSLLQHPSEPLSDLGYYQCVDTIIEHSKTLGQSMSGMANHARESEHEQLGKSVKTLSESICGLIECTAQAAYLVAVSDPTSAAGRPGLVDQSQFARASQVIRQACDSLLNPASNEGQVLSAATHIAKHTSALCNACRTASSKTTNPVAKRHFVQSAKEVANSTALLVKEIKALDSDYSEANRSRCSQATKPLLEAVSSLCQFAGSAEFVSVPARISAQGRRAQEPILDSGRKIIQGSCSMIDSSKSLAVEPNDREQWTYLATHSKTVTESIKSLVNNIRDKAPGQGECLSALDILNSQIRELDQAALMAVSQTLPVRKGNTLQGYTEQLESSANEMLDKIEPLRAAAKFEAENLGHSVNQMVSYAEPLTTSAIGVASNMVESQRQQQLLDQTKTMLEGAMQLILAAKEAGGNPRATNVHPDIDEYSQGVRDAAGELLNSAEAISAQRGIVSGLLDSLTRSMTRITDHRMSLIGSFNEADSFVDYQTRMVVAAKEIAKIATEMTAKSGTDVSKLATLAGDLTHKYNQLAQDSVGAAATTTNNDVGQRIRSSVVELGTSVVTLVKAGGLCQVSRDTGAQRDVTDGAKHVSEKVGAVLSALQAGSRGTQACIDAAATISAIIGDLDTTILFASAGTLHAENENDSFADHRESILKTAKALVEDTKTLVGGAASSQEQLASAAQNAVSTIVQLSSVVKQGAMSLGSGNPDSQVMLIHAVRDVAAALRDLVQATKDASGKHIADPAMPRLKESAKVMVTNVTSLLKTVKAVEDEHTRGTRALEATIEAIAQEIRLLLSPGAPKLTATPEELVRCTKAITVATAKAVAAGNSAKQDDVIAAANIGRKAIGDMLAICKGAAYKCAETEELRERTLKAGHSAATSYRELLLAVLKSVQGQPSARQTFPDLSKAVAHAAADIVAAAEALKGSDWVDPDDPTVIAENELLGAAASIDAAANKLAALRPRKSVKEADETLNFDEMILEAAKSIIAATSALVRAASAAQRELIDQGKVARRPLYSSDDGQWSEGLVSAARLAAAAAHSLAESANALVQGLGSEERLVSSAKQVASSTAQLLVACKVKADPNSESTRRLQAAGNAVIRSTDNLVRAAQRAISHEEERHLVLNTKMVGGIAQEINARSEVLRIERELDEARGRLMAIRQAKYKLKGGDTSGDETDTEITLHTSRKFNQSTSPFQQSTLNRQDGGYLSDGSNRNRTINSTFEQSNTSFGQNTSSTFGHSTFNQNTTNAYGQNSSYTSQPSPIGKLSTFSSQQTVEKTKFPSPPPPNPPPPMTTNLSTFTRTINTNDELNKISKPAQSYEGFTTRPPNKSNKNYETRCYETPRSLCISPEYYATKAEEEHKSYQESSSAFQTYSSSKDNKYDTPRITTGLEKPKPIVTSPMSPKFNAKFDLKREFESSDLSRNNYSQNVLSSAHDSKSEQMYSTVRKSDFSSPTPYVYGSKSPTSPKPFSVDNMKIESFTQQKSADQSPFSTLGSNYAKSPVSPTVGNTGYSEVNQAYNFKSETLSKDQMKPSSDLARIQSPTQPKQENVQLFGKEVYTYGGPNYSQETMTEVKEIPNGTQKVTTTKIYSSTPMKITSTNMKYESQGKAQPNFSAMNEFTREFGANESNFGTLDSNYGTDTMKSYTSQSSNDTLKGGPSFLRPSDFGQSDYQSKTMVSKTVKSPADLAKELDSMERKLLKQTISSEVIEKKTVMTTSSKSETSSTTTKKFGNY